MCYSDAGCNESFLNTYVNQKSVYQWEICLGGLNVGHKSEDRILNRGLYVLGHCSVM